MKEYLKAKKLLEGSSRTEPTFSNFDGKVAKDATAVNDAPVQTEALSFSASRKSISIPVGVESSFSAIRKTPKNILTGLKALVPQTLNAREGADEVIAEPDESGVVVGDSRNISPRSIKSAFISMSGVGSAQENTKSPLVGVSSTAAVVKEVVEQNAAVVAPPSLKSAQGDWVLETAATAKSTSEKPRFRLQVNTSPDVSQLAMPAEPVLPRSVFSDKATDFDNALKYYNKALIVNKKAPVFSVTEETSERMTEDASSVKPKPVMFPSSEQVRKQSAQLMQVGQSVASSAAKASKSVLPLASKTAAAVVKPVFAAGMMAKRAWDGHSERSVERFVNAMERSRVAALAQIRQTFDLNKPCEGDFDTGTLRYSQAYISEHNFKAVAQLSSFAILLLLCFSFAANLWFNDEHGFGFRQNLEADLAMINAEIDQIASENAFLDQKVENLRTDSQAMESMARYQFGMIKPDETFIRIVN